MTTITAGSVWISKDTRDAGREIVVESAGTHEGDDVTYRRLVDGKPFHPDRLESHRSEVAAWLSALPHNFRASKGGAWSFLNACEDDAGEQWGEHRDMEALFVLGAGLGLSKFLLPREMWDVLPGAMPYISVSV